MLTLDNHDYRTVAELMGSIVSEASGAGIEKEVQETIDAVTSATASLASNEGATADKIAKLLRLDKSSAWRRLNKAIFKGFIVNLETRRGQPGRYRVTNQEVEVEELLPSPKALVDPPETHATVQPVTQVIENKDENGCAAGCNPHATAHATAKPLIDIEKVPPVARLHGLQGGIREEHAHGRCAQCGEPGKLVEASDGTHTARLHRECLNAWAANVGPTCLLPWTGVAARAFRMLAEPQVLRPFQRNEVLSIAEAAQIAGRSVRTLREWCLLYDIGRRIGGQWAVSCVALSMFLDGNREALRGYLSGDRQSEIVLEYFRRHGIASPIRLASLTSNISTAAIRL